jgi:hypothetical protein
MIQHGDSSRLTLKEASGFLTFKDPWISGRLGSYDFDCNLPVKARIFCQVHLTHAAASDLAYETVVTQL